MTDKCSAFHFLVNQVYLRTQTDIANITTQTYSQQLIWTEQQQKTIQKLPLLYFTAQYTFALKHKTEKEYNKQIYYTRRKNKTR